MDESKVFVWLLDGVERPLIEPTVVALLDRVGLLEGEVLVTLGSL